MRLSELAITNFKNIASATLSFSPKVNCFLGNNGMGKSNLLDAIYCLSFTKSFYGVADALIMRRDEEFMMVKGTYVRGDTPEELLLGMTRGRRKQLKRGGKEYDRLSRHIGLFPLVMVSPHDIDLIQGAPEQRRRWADMMVSQSDKVYLDHLIRYNRALEQRNALLRDGRTDPALFAAIEMQMEIAAGYIARARRDMTQRLVPLFRRFYNAIAGDSAEHVDLTYDGWDTAPEARGSLTNLLDACRRHDEIVRHTGAGPHRDDFTMLLDGMEARRTGSQGQCKTFTVALRLAQYTFLAQATGLKPLLLLDDVFDKLDATRVERIMTLVTGDEFGQIFVTDTNRTHLDDIMRRTSGNYRLWTVDHGRFTPGPHNGDIGPLTSQNMNE